MADIGDQRVQPALHAMLDGDRDGLQQVIDADPEIATIRWGDNTLLEWATQPPHGIHPDIIDVLIAAGSELDRALNLAACWNLADLCRQLLAAGADPAARADAGITPLESAAMHGSTVSADVLAPHGLHRPSLWLAAAAGLTDAVHTWIASDGSLTRPAGPYRPNLTDVGHPPAPAPGDTPSDVLSEAMVFAGANGRSDTVDYLLDIGISIDARLPNNTTALHLAIMFTDPAAVRTLLQRGARTDIVDDHHHSDAARWAQSCLTDDPASHEIAQLLSVRP